MSKNINPNINRFLGKKRDFSVKEYVEGIKNGDRNILSRAISLLESTKETDKAKASAIVQECLEYSGNSRRIGITGVPGVGKSTFINVFGKKLIENGHKIAILAIDPSSGMTGGSILGDKTRMTYLSGREEAFIRPSPSAGSLGGVAAKTREALILCEAAGFDTVIIETVGVGQSETAVSTMVDVFVLLLVAGTGDELQGIKRGIMEMTDILIFTKDDGDNKTRTDVAKRQFSSALKLFPAKESQWKPEVTSVSSVEERGFENVIKILDTYFLFIKNNGFFEKNRKNQAVKWFYEQIDNEIKNLFFESEIVKNNLLEFEKNVLERKKSPIGAANELINLFLKNR